MNPAALPINLDALDHELVFRLQTELSLLRVLDDWTVQANNDLLPRLRQVQAFLRSLHYQPEAAYDVYRGFSLGSFQDKLGLSKADVTLDHAFAHCFSRPTSFSTAIKIAQAYGEIVVHAPLGSKPDVIFLTDEVMYVVEKLIRGKDDPMTEKEVIVMPEVTLQLEIVRLARQPACLSW